MEIALLIIGFLLLCSVLVSSLSSRLGVPVLVLFIGVGMLAGSEGPGGIYFDSADVARNIGTITLALILFSGGLDSNFRAMLPVLASGLSLATLGTFFTAGLVGYFAHIIFDLTLLEGLLLGSVIASTDAAAVFGILRAKGIRLKHRLGHLLELESGSNDPTAVFLTLALTAMLGQQSTSLAFFVFDFFYQMGLGFCCGVIGGLSCSWIINKLRIDFDGLYPAFTVATAFITFGGSAALGGNGFLAVYVAGVVLGNRKFAHRESVLLFHDALSWLMQIAMFLVLGLLVFPSQLPEVAVSALLIALFLAFVARPLAVFVCLSLSKKFDWRDKLFISWVGLRGAVPIVLATIPLTENLEKAPLIFNTVFFIVLVSVLMQGSSITALAKFLRLSKTGDDFISERRIASQLTEVTIREGSPAIGKQIVDLGLPETSLIVRLSRGKASYIPRGSTIFEEGDTLLLSCSSHDQSIIKEIFGNLRTTAV